MPIPDPDKIWPDLEQSGVDEVRKKLAMGAYAKYKIPVIEEWLRRKEEDLASLAVEPKAPTIVQNIAWILKYGWHHKGLLLLAALFVFSSWILTTHWRTSQTQLKEREFDWGKLYETPLRTGSEMERPLTRKRNDR